MKTQKIFSHFIATSLALLLLFACRSELDVSNAQNQETLQTRSSNMTSKLISVENLKNKIQNWEQVTASIKKFKKNDFAKLQSNSNIFYREIIDPQNNIITYTLPLTSYSSQNPFYLIQQIIVPQNGQQRIQYLKIIPNNPPQYITQDVLKTLTGSIERLDQNLMLLNSTPYENGKVVKTGNGSTSGKNLCIEVTEVIEVTCTNGGNHGVDESCGPGFTNDAHFVETTYTVCAPGGSEGTNPIPGSGGGIEGGYVFDEQLNSLLTNPTFQYTDYITDPSRNLLLQAVRAWIPTNITDINGDLTDLNNRLQYFINNDQIFTNLAIYDQNTPNVPNAEVADYSVRVYELIKWLLNNPSDHNAKLTVWGVKFLDENRLDVLEPENLINRIIVLEDALVQNPNKLLDIQCTQLPFWQDIATHQVPQSVKDKIQNIPNQNSYWTSWDITNLDNGAGPSVNLDLFPIKISTMPNKPNSNQKYTPAEFFEFFRKNINLFAEKFTPIEDNTYNIHDTALWNSSNPLGSLIHINITPDDGTVVCSGVSTNTWIFSTIKAPLDWSYDGIHPVAGNRAFSYYMEGNTMYIYTRGVDRFSLTSNIPLISYAMEATAFAGADDLWTEMQNKLSAYVNSKGGTSNTVTPVIYRPNYNGIKNYLKGQAPLSSLGCN